MTRLERITLLLTAVRGAVADGDTERAAEIAGTLLDLVGRLQPDENDLDAVVALRADIEQVIAEMSALCGGAAEEMALIERARDIARRVGLEG